MAQTCKHGAHSGPCGVCADEAGQEFAKQVNERIEAIERVIREYPHSRSECLWCGETLEFISSPSDFDIIDAYTTKHRGCQKAYQRGQQWALELFRDAAYNKGISFVMTTEFPDGLSADDWLAARIKEML